MVSCDKDKLDNPDDVDKHVNPELNQSNSIDNNLISNGGDGSFQRLIGGKELDAFYAVEQTADLGFIFCGFTSNDTASERDIFIFKTSVYGETDWIKLFSDDYTDEGWDIELTEDDDYIIAATSNLQAYSQYLRNPYCGQLLKISSNGLQLWKKSFEFGDFTHFSCVRQTDDGGYIVAGTEFSTEQAILLKTDENGQEKWRKSFSNKSEFSYIDNTTDEGFIVCGIDYSNPIKQRDIYIVKLNDVGDTLWTNTIGDDYDNTPTAIKTISTGYVICGYNTNLPTGASGFISTLDINCNIIWTKDYQSDNVQAIHDIISTKDNEFTFIGSESFSDGSKSYLVKIKSNNGDVIWKKTFNPGNYNMLNEIQQTDDGYIIAGYSLNSDNGNGYIIKIDNEGN